MWENAYLSIKNPKGGSGLCLQIACATPLGYVSNFWPQKLPPLPNWRNPGSVSGKYKFLEEILQSE